MLLAVHKHITKLKIRKAKNADANESEVNEETMKNIMSSQAGHLCSSHPTRRHAQGCNHKRQSFRRAWLKD